jgi:GntR family transcriptional regulator/MocR family aminotransferase
VEAALEELVAESYIVRRRGAGTFVAASLPESDGSPQMPANRTATPQNPMKPRRLSTRAAALKVYPGHTNLSLAVPFAPSLPPIDVFPRQVWNRLLLREARRKGDEYWAYGASNGLRTLREAIAGHAAAMRATNSSPEQVIVVTSTQQAIELTAKVLANQGDSAWVESPGYPAARHSLAAAGLIVVPVPVDTHGLVVEHGQSVANGARLAYVTPSHQYPLGVEMSIDRRQALLTWAEENDAYVIEDDYDGDYRYEGRPIASLQGMDAGQRTIYIGSFSKAAFPALRIAYAIVPESLVGAFVDAKHVADGHNASLLQGVLAAFIQEGHLASHLRKTRSLYNERRQIFLQASEVLQDWIEFGPARAGMHVTGHIWRSCGLDDVALAATCAERGIIVHPLSRCGTTNYGGLIFGFAGATDRIAKTGLAIVRQAILEVAT